MAALARQDLSVLGLVILYHAAMDAIHVLFRVMHISGIALLVAGVILGLLSHLRIKRCLKEIAGEKDGGLKSDEQDKSSREKDVLWVLEPLKKRGWMITNIAAAMIIISGVYQWVRSTPAYADVGSYVTQTILLKIALGVTTLALIYLQAVDLLAGRRTRTWLVVNLLLILLVMMLGAYVRHWRLADQFL